MKLIDFSLSESDHKNIGNYTRFYPRVKKELTLQSRSNRQ